MPGQARRTAVRMAGGEVGCVGRGGRTRPAVPTAVRVQACGPGVLPRPGWHPEARTVLHGQGPVARVPGQGDEFLRQSADLAVEERAAAGDGACPPATWDRSPCPSAAVD